MRNHVVVCGLGQVGYRVTDLLLRLGEKVTVITLESRPHWLRDVQERGASVVLGDARDEAQLTLAGIVEAKALIVCADQDLVNLEVSLDARRLSPRLRIVARLFDQNLARRLEESLGIDRALAMSALASPAFAAAAFGEEVLAAFDIGGRQFVVGRLDVSHESALGGLSTADIAKKFNLATLLHSPSSDRESANVKLGDRIKLIGASDAFSQVAPLNYIAVRRPDRVISRWARFLSAIDPRRGFFFMREVWRNVSLPLRSAFILLLVLTGVSVGVFHWGMGLSVVDALYFVITTLTTTGYGDINLKDEGTVLKLYGVLLMLLGSAGIALVYSMITDYIVTNRFQQLAGRLRIPEEEHVIVVGLGNVGYRTVAELEKMNARVVAIESDAQADFLSNIRLRTPAVIGDARESDTLTRAGIERATAIIAVTSSDAVNLSIGLLARHLNPKARTVLRIFDGDLAVKVQTALDVDIAMSASRLAAPSFVAAALHGDVVAAFAARNRLFCLVAAQARKDWIGKSVEEVHHESVDRVLLRIDSDGSAIAVHVGSVVEKGDLIVSVIEHTLSPL